MRRSDPVSFAYMDVAVRCPGKGREQDAVSFAYMDVAVRRPGKGREQDAVSFTHRLSSLIYIAEESRDYALHRHEPTDSGYIQHLSHPRCARYVGSKRRIALHSPKTVHPVHIATV